MELPVGQMAPETLLDAFTTKFHTLSANLRKAPSQVDKLKFDHHQLSAERDALAARVAALQKQIQDAAIHQALRWNFFHSPAADQDVSVLEDSFHAHGIGHEVTETGNLYRTAYPLPL